MLNFHNTTKKAIITVDWAKLPPGSVIVFQGDTYVTENGQDFELAEGCEKPTHRYDSGRIENCESLDTTPSPDSTDQVDPA